MKYQNAETVLPKKLLEELQKYVQGEIIYVPSSNSDRVKWGEANGTKEKYQARNNEIVTLYRSGASVNKISEDYYLSEYSIRKIVGKRKI